MSVLSLHWSSVSRFVYLNSSAYVPMYKSECVCPCLRASALRTIPHNVECIVCALVSVHFIMDLPHYAGVNAFKRVYMRTCTWYKLWRQRQPCWLQLDKAWWCSITRKPGTTPERPFRLAPFRTQRTPIKKLSKTYVFLKTRVSRTKIQTHFAQIS